MLLGPNRLELDALADLERGQALLGFTFDVGLVLVVVLVIRGEKAGLEQGLAIRAQDVPRRAVAAFGSPATRSTATVSNTAGAIWQAIARFHTSA